MFLSVWWEQDFQIDLHPLKSDFVARTFGANLIESRRAELVAGDKYFVDAVPINDSSQGTISGKHGQTVDNIAFLTRVVIHKTD